MGLISNQNRRLVIATINDYIEKILRYCGFKISSNRKYIAEDVFELFGYIMSLTEKYIGNIPKDFRSVLQIMQESSSYYAKLIY